MCWGALGVAALMLLLFILDIALKIPFGGLDTTVDILAIIASAVLLYLAIDTLRELR